MFLLYVENPEKRVPSWLRAGKTSPTRRVWLVQDVLMWICGHMDFYMLCIFCWWYIFICVYIIYFHTVLVGYGSDSFRFTIVFHARKTLMLSKVSGAWRRCRVGFCWPAECEIELRSFSSARDFHFVLSKWKQVFQLGDSTWNGPSNINQP